MTLRYNYVRIYLRSDELDYLTRILDANLSGLVPKVDTKDRILHIALTDKFYDAIKRREAKEVIAND